MRISDSRRPVPEGFVPLTEGKATILQRKNEVFYNPAQVVNRDLSVTVLRYFCDLLQEEAKAGGNRNARDLAKAREEAGGLHVLEGLAASGLRAVRYAKEIPGVARVTANDLDPNVVEALTRNVDYNDVPRTKVVPSTGDARLVMLQNEGVFDAIDLDPYGSPSTLIDSAVSSVRDGGLLLVTATDMAVLCGNNSETCFAKYGSYPLHKPYCHEMALRILLYSLETAAARYKRYIQPIASFSIDFYVRVFVRVRASAKVTKDAATRLGYVWQSAACDTFEWQRVGRKIQRGNSTKYSPGVGPTVPPKCPDTGANWTMGGPFWAEPIHDQAALKSMLEHIEANRADFGAYDRIRALLTTAHEELPDVPLYINLHDACKTLRCTPPRAEYVRSALVNAGYRVSSTHANPLGIKTDAPFDVFWDIMRCWIADHPIKNLPPDSAGAKILAKEPTLKADFTRTAKAASKAKTNKVARFLPNPTANWGPKPKHGRHLPGQEIVSAAPAAAAASDVVDDAVVDASMEDPAAEAEAEATIRAAADAADEVANEVAAEVAEFEEELAAEAAEADEETAAEAVEVEQEAAAEAAEAEQEAAAEAAEVSEEAAADDLAVPKEEAK